MKKRLAKSLSKGGRRASTIRGSRKGAFSVSLITRKGRKVPKKKILGRSTAKTR